MARTRTLAQLEADVLWQADREGTALRNASSQVRRAINQSIAEFREAVSESGDPYFLEKHTDTLSVGPTSPYHFAVLDLSSLSPAHLRVYGFDVNVNGFWRSLDPAMFRERNDVQVLQAGGSSIPLQFFQFDRSSVGYAPASDAAYNFLLWYLPVHDDLTDDADAFDGMNGWEDWVVFNAVSRLLLRDRDAHLERFEAERARILTRVLHVARQRQRAGAHVRGGVRGGNDWRGRGRPDFLGGPGDALNQPGSGEGGRVAVARSDGKINWTPGLDEGDDLKWAGGVWVKRRSWITVDYDTTGVVSAKAAIAAALAAARPGQCVYVPDGIALIDGGSADALTIPKGVTLTGSEKGFEPGSRTLNDGLTTSGTQLNVTTTGKLCQPGRSSVFQHFTLYYPNQNANATPAAYDWSVYIPTNTPTPTVRNITAINPYKFLYCDSPTRVDEIYGFPLSQGIHLGRVADVMRVSNVHFNSNNYSHGSTLIDWVKEHGRAFVVEQAEQFSFHDCFAILYFIGIDFKVEATPDGSGSYGEWVGGGIDATQYCVVVNTTTALSAAGFKMIGASLVPLSLGVAILCQDTVDTSSAPVIDFQGSVHGAHDTDVWLKSGSNALVRVHHSTLEGQALRSYLNESSTGRIEYDHVRTPFANPRAGVTGNPCVDRHGQVAASTLGTEDLGAAYRTAQTTSIGATSLFPSAPPRGDYLVTINLACTTASGSGSPTLTATIGWTDDAGATTYTTTTLSLAATGRLKDTLTIRVTGAANITFATTVASAAGSPQYSVAIRAVQL